MQEFKPLQIFLSETERKAFMNKHSFLYSQSKVRLLAHFSDLQKETTEFTEQLIQNEIYNTIVYEDEYSAYTAIEAAAFSHYCLLHEMHREVLLSITSMMYFEFDKILRNWLLNAISQLCLISHLSEWIWKKDISYIYALLELFGFEVKKLNYFKQLDAMRIVVNVYKHGNGFSKRLKKVLSRVFKCRIY